MDSPVMLISLLSLVLITSVVVYLIRRDIIQNRIFNLHAIGYKLFYYRNMLTSEEHISYSLKRLLELKDGSDSINALVNSLVLQDQTKLSGMYEVLAAPGKASDKVFAGEGDIAIKLELRGNNEITHLSCQYLVLNDNNGFAQGFFLFFGNITLDMLKMDELRNQNLSLKADLAMKNNLLNTLPMPVWLRDKDLRIVYFNNQFDKIAINKPGESPELDKQSKHLAQLAQEAQLERHEERHVIIDGQRYLYQFLEVPVVNSDEMAGMGYDVTSKEQVKADLERHISAQADLLESTASAIAIYGADTKLQFFNQAFRKLWDLDDNWLVTNPTYAQILERLREKRQLPEQVDFQKYKAEQVKLFTDLITTRNDFLSLPDGRYLRVIIIAHAFGGLLFSYEDMSDRLQLERSYKTLGAVQKETIDNLNEGVTVFSESGKLELNNEKFLKIWKQDQKYVDSKPHLAELLAKMCEALAPVTDREEFKKLFTACVHSRTTSNHRVELQSEMMIDILYVPLPDGGTLVSYHDVTDSIVVERSLREKNQALQEADHLKAEFLANVSYELRSPLNSIMGFSEALDKRFFGGLNDKQSDYVKAIHDSSHSLKALINDIIDLASIDAGYMTLDLEWFDVCASISTIMPAIKERIKIRKLKFKFECQDDVPKMIGDEKRIKQAIFTLLNNIIESALEGGVIKLLICAQDTDIIFVVDAVGLCAPEKQRIFDSFYRNNTAGKTKKFGVGLEMPLVKRFVEMHGGEVIVENIKDKDTQFKCILPIQNPALLAEYEGGQATIREGK